MNKEYDEEDDDQEFGYEPPYFDRFEDPLLMNTLHSMEYLDSLKWASFVGFLLDNPKAHFKITILKDEVLVVEAGENTLELNLLN